MQKVNVRRIIKDHLAAIRGVEESGGQVRVLLRFWLPVFSLAAALACARPVTGDLGRALVYVCLVLAFALTNGLFHLLRISSSSSGRGSQMEQRAALLKAAHAHLSFSLLLAIITPMLSLGYLIIAPGRAWAVPYSFAIYVLAGALSSAVLAFLCRLQALVRMEL